MNKQQIEYINTAELVPYARNSRTHPQVQVSQIAASIKEFGFTNPVLIDNNNGIIAGHGRVMGASLLKMDTVPCIRLGYLTDNQKRAYIIADNKIALNAEWDNDLLKLEFDDLAQMDFDLSLTGFDMGEIEELGFGDESEDQPGGEYTNKVDTPNYIPNGEKPELHELYDNEKAKNLIKEIKGSSLPQDEKEFLIAAAYRHVVFDFGKIANYYAHSASDVQEKMENSALVIIDFKKAIAEAFVVLNDKISMHYIEEQEDA
jgi:hypothetical protein